MERTMYQVTPLRILAVLALYAAIYVVIRAIARNGTAPAERKTALVIGLSWAVCVFIANYLLYLAGFMSFLPWPNNFLHTFIWIGLCLTPLYLGVREDLPMAQQFVLFATFSLVVKYGEQKLFGTWDLNHFFHIFRGNAAYVLGWSLADGLYPALTMYGLRLVARWIPGLIVQ
jgi:hypothetical protein